MTVKPISVIITHGRIEKLHMEAYSLFFYFKHSNIYKRKYALTAEAREHYSKARVFTKLWKTVNKQPKQPKAMRVFQATTTNPYYPIRVCIRWNSHGKSKAYRGFHCHHNLVLNAQEKKRDEWYLHIHHVLLLDILLKAKSSINWEMCSEIIRKWASSFLTFNTSERWTLITSKHCD